MNDRKPPEKSAIDGFAGKLKTIFIGALFALVLLVPKLLHLRRDPRAWLAFRIVLGLAGAALVVFPLGLWKSWLLPIVGLAMFMTAVLLPPARPDYSVDEKARELGALVVVNGGEYQPGNGLPAAVRLFVGAERIWVLDGAFRPALVIPVGEIRTLRTFPASNQAQLRIEWHDHAAEFTYHGFFAPHLAGVAETTIRGVLPAAFPILEQQKPQSRAARA